jgi:hypothetical protein
MLCEPIWFGSRPAGSLCPLTECIFQSAIEHMNANVEKALNGVPVPSHLLFLHHPFRDDLIDSRLDEAVEIRCPAR